MTVSGPHTAHPRTRGGLGVGLSLARSVIELHGGTIEAILDQTEALESSLDRSRGRREP